MTSKFISLPLWFFLAVWLLLPRPKVITKKDMVEYLDIFAEILTAIKALPRPFNWFQGYLRDIIVNWIEKQVNSIETLISLDVSDMALWM